MKFWQSLQVSMVLPKVKPMQTTFLTFGKTIALKYNILLKVYPVYSTLQNTLSWSNLQMWTSTIKIKQ